MNVYNLLGDYCATISKIKKSADTAYPACDHYALLHYGGRLHGKAVRFDTYGEARDEALKEYPGCSFRRI